MPGLFTPSQSAGEDSGLVLMMRATCTYVVYGSHYFYNILGGNNSLEIES